jgi:hypothetical protein
MEKTMETTKYKRNHECLNNCSVEEKDSYINVSTWESDFLYGYFKPDKNITYEEQPNMEGHHCSVWDDRILRLLDFYFEVQNEMGLSFLHCSKSMNEFFLEEEKKLADEGFSEPTMGIGHYYKEYHKYLSFGEICIQFELMNDPDAPSDLSSERNTIVGIAKQCGFSVSQKDKTKNVLTLRLPEEYFTIT